ncbi:MAG: DUF1540 domain-containing protein [Clostridiales bacterium]|nr:DUF1540 domain-containing protein [Clostridiales bacterium]
MPILDCSVATCVHNEENRCCLNSILVDGQNAEKEEETKCSSFAHRTEGCCNRCGEDPKVKLVVDCKAVDCIYNKDRLCSASHIDISGRQAKNSEETLCASFTAK